MASPQMAMYNNPQNQGMMQNPQDPRTSSGQILSDIQTDNPVGEAGSMFLGQQQNALQGEQNLQGSIANAMGNYQHQAAPQAGYSNAGPVNQSQGVNAHGTALQGAAQAGYSGIDQSSYGQSRDMQMANIHALQQQAAGQGPSVAAQQAQNSEQANIAGQMAMMASQRGAANSSQGMRQAAIQGSQAQQQAANQAVTGRMQEQMNAQQQLGSVINGQQSQDANLAINQAGLNQNVNLANQSATNQRNLNAAQLGQQNNQFNAGLASANNQFNAGQGNQYQMNQAQLNQQANLANQQAQLSQTGMNNQMTANLYGQQGDLLSNQASNNLADANMLTNANEYDRTQTHQEGQDSFNNGMKVYGAASSFVGGLFSDENMKQDTRSGDGQIQAFLTQIGAANAHPSAPPAPDTTSSSSGSKGMDMSSMMKSFGGKSGSDSSSGGDDSDLGTGAGAEMSDENEKRSIDSSDDEYQTQSFLDALKAHSYEYKDPANGRGKFLGPMAQELEKTDAGKQAVIDTPRGKMVDTGRVALMSLAALASEHKKRKDLELRVSNLEGMTSGKRQK